MARLMLVLALVFCIAAIGACGEDPGPVSCELNGGCLDDLDCDFGCPLACDGEVLSAFCNRRENCVCECEFACDETVPRGG